MSAVYPDSPRAALEALRGLERRLADPGRRAGALADLRALADLARDRPEGAPLRLAEVDVAVGAAQERLELLLLPSTFAPEAWARTFLEGLLRVPPEEYAGRSLVEVGAGSGWICIALARFTALERIHGVDLNPRAATVAACNAWLNGGEVVAARLGFGAADLLRGAPEGPWDFVIGCIPQVLGEEDLSAALDAGDERALADLSNYCALQNVYEDQFGLGLIARLLDEVPDHLAPGGRLLLNLAGRPGRALIERMFTRRGFHTRIVVARRVRQADDTDIAPLARLEARTGREFEFYLEPHSPEPIRAATALGWLRAGNPVWHEVAVWEARPALPRETAALRAGLRAAGAEGLLREIDLTDATAEQVGFVATLAERLARGAAMPYAHESGDAALRETVVRYLDRYFALRLDSAELFVGPDRAQTVHALLLATCDPGDRVLVSRSVHAVYADALERAGVEAVVVHDVLGEIRRLLDAFPVRAAILSVVPGERANLPALREIAAEAERRGTLVVLDESASFNITGAVETRTVFDAMAREPYPPNVVVLYGLIKNAVYPDLELTLLLPVAARLRVDLEVAAELTYSRVSTPAEWLYERLFAELLDVRVSFRAPEPPAPRPVADGTLPRSDRIARAAAHPAFAPPVWDASDPRRVRLDYGENEGPMPAPLVEGLLAAAAAPPGDDAPTGLEAAVAAFLRETRGTGWTAEEVVAAQGVWPLMGDLAAALRTLLGRAPRVWLAAPCYGVLPPAWEAAGCEVEVAPLDDLLSRDDAPDAVVVSQPVNPTGAFLSADELRMLLRRAAERGTRIVSDEVFGLVELADPEAETVPSPAPLEAEVPGAAGRTVVLGGVSKEFAAGGLRVGWLASRDRALVEAVRAASLAAPHRIAARAAAHLYAAWSRGPDGGWAHPERRAAALAHLTEMRRDLAEKRALLLGALPGGDPAEGRRPGGLFVAPRVTAWLGRAVDGVVLDPANLPRVVYERTGVALNGGPWCSDPERVRAVFSVPGDRLARACDALRAFAAEAGLPPGGGEGDLSSPPSDDPEP